MALGDSKAPMNLANSLASSSAAPLAKFAVGFPIAFHYLGACRHAVWDLTAKGFTNQSMLSSSYALFGASAVMTLGLMCTTLEPKKDERM